MYSVVLMAVMTTGIDAPDARRRGGGCRGGRGCYCSCYCSGGYGCYGGGCYGGGCYGGYGCFGGGCYGGGFAYGGYGGYGGYGYGGYGRGRGYGVGRRGGRAAIVIPSTMVVAYGGNAAPGAVALPATLTVTLPADATLSVDGQRMRSTSSRRVFVSPPLQTGRSYTYTLEAQVVRNGQRLSVTREVPVRAGRQTAVNLDMPTFTAAASE